MRGVKTFLIILLLVLFLPAKAAGDVLERIDSEAVQVLTGWDTLQLFDCLAAFDAFLEKKAVDGVEPADRSVDDIKRVRAWFDEAVKHKTGKSASSAKLLEVSSFHKSSLYLSGAEHGAYQTKVLSFCGKEVVGITSNATLKVVGK